MTPISPARTECAETAPASPFARETGGKKKKRAFYDVHSLPLTIIELCASQPHYVWTGAKCLREAALKINGSELLGGRDVGRRHMDNEDILLQESAAVRTSAGDRSWAGAERVHVGEAATTQGTPPPRPAGSCFVTGFPALGPG